MNSVEGVGSGVTGTGDRETWVDRRLKRRLEVIENMKKQQLECEKENEPTTLEWNPENKEKINALKRGIKKEFYGKNYVDVIFDNGRRNHSLVYANRPRIMKDIPS